MVFYQQDPLIFCIRQAIVQALSCLIFTYTHAQRNLGIQTLRRDG